MTLDEKLARLAPNTLGTLAFLLMFGGAGKALAAFRRGERLWAAGMSVWTLLLLAAAAIPSRFPAPWPPLDHLGVKLAGILLVSLGLAIAAAPDEKRRLPAGAGPVLIQAGATALFPQWVFALALVLMAWGAAAPSRRPLL